MGACGSSNFYEDHDNNTPRGSDWGKSGNLPRYLEILYDFVGGFSLLGFANPKYGPVISSLAWFSLTCSICKWKVPPY